MKELDQKDLLGTEEEQENTENLLHLQYTWSTLRTGFESRSTF